MISYLLSVTRRMNLQLIFTIVFFQCLLAPLEANALPAFARQTGQNCIACHAGGQFPELTPFGRLFKLTGYTLGNKNSPSVAVMGVGSFTKTSDPTVDAAFAKDAAAIFQTGSVFVAGKVADNVGMFAQASYNPYDNQNTPTGRWQGKWSSDNVDLRYVQQLNAYQQNLQVGLSLNNNPTVADPWNTAPAWLQYVPTQFGVTGPDASPIVTQLGAQVAGLSAYAFINQTLYVELAAYQTANGVWSFLSKGNSNADQVKLKGTNPYLRVALSRNWGPHNAMVGAFALNANIYPNNLAPSGPATAYRDRGVDAQYQYLMDAHAATLQLSYINEAISNGDVTGIATYAINRLDQFRAKASYVHQATFGTSISYFNTTGSADSTLYPDPANSPGTRGWIPEIFWIPVQNIRVGTQYFAFNRFHGANSNYDGAGRSASSNNTLFAYVWAAY